MMNKKHVPNHAFDLEKVEKWLETYFLDPLTSYYDQTQFKIDLYETEREWIVEAMLNDYEASDIKVYLEEKTLKISVHKYPPSPSETKRFRAIDFPFHVTFHKVSALFHNGILEVFISKTEKGLGKNRYITLP